MSDTSLNTIIQYGTQAARIAFTPDPAVGSQVLYLWYETDNEPDLYAWNGATWEWVNDPSVVGGITQLTGDVTAGPGSGSQAATIANDAVTFAKMQNINTDVLLGRDTAAAGNVEEIAVSNGIEFNAGPGIQLTAAQRTRVITVNINGAGNVITTGVKGYIQVPVAMTLTGWTILSQDGISGDIVIDVWNDTLANFPPTDADSITGGNEPEVSGDDNATGSVAGWSDTTLAADSILGFNVDLVTDLENVTFQLFGTVD